MGNVSGRNLRDHPSPPNQYTNPNHPPLQYYPPTPSPYHHHEAWVFRPLPYVDHHKATMIRNDIDLKKETFRFEPDEENPGKFLVSFTIDANVSGSVTVMFFAKEGAEGNLSATKEDQFPSLTFSFTKGVGQKFNQPFGYKQCFTSKV